MNAKAIGAAVLTLCMSGCASQPPVKAPRVSARIILLPSHTDRPSAVVVKTSDAEVLLERPYGGLEVQGTALVVRDSSAEDVNQRYGALLAAQPKPPRPFTMHFMLGSDDLTASSKAAFEQARQEIGAWKGVEVVVIGHTDRLGSTEYNDALSRQRAQLVARRLIASGVPTGVIEVASRGEREPLVPTSDGVPEPRNRRVEIKVR